MRLSQLPEHARALLAVRQAARSLVRTPGFTAAAGFILAIATGLNITMFSVVNAVLLRS